MADDPITSFRIGYAFLSNFYAHPVGIDGDTYPTNEHAFQALKTDDPAERLKVREAKTPTSAKSLGKRVTLREDWDTVRFEVMERVVRAKFADPELAPPARDAAETMLAAATEITRGQLRQIVVLLVKRVETPVVIPGVHVRKQNTGLRRHARVYMNIENQDGVSVWLVPFHLLRYQGRRSCSSPPHHTGRNDVGQRLTVLNVTIRRC